MRIELRSPTGDIADDRIRAWIGPRVPTSQAGRRIRDFPVDPNGNEEYRVERCHRFDRHRVDCRVLWHPPDRGTPRCARIWSARILRTGLPEYGDYRCDSGFRARRGTY